MTKNILEKDVISIFDEIAKIYCQKTALGDEDNKITYGQLKKMSEGVAQILISENVEAESIVPVIVDRSVNAVIDILGILKANAAYMPIDILYPKDRINYMIEMSKSKIVICTCKADFEKIKAIVPCGIKVLYFDKEKLQENPSFLVANKRNSNSLAYVIFTSGSEGKPKGVMIEDAGIVRLVKETDYFPFSDERVFLQSGTLCFDAATFDVFGALLNGGTVYMVEKNTLLDPKLLKNKLQKYNADSMFLTTPLFHQLVTADYSTFESLKNLLVGGDVLFLQDALLLKSKYPEMNFLNVYGPTENTTFSTKYKITGNEETDIPIGSCIKNSNGYVLDEKLCPVLPGEKGELYVGGPGVARGYLDNEKLTSEKFLPDINGKGKMYKTGDLVSQDSFGNFHFYGRIDSQIKLRGFRIELSEIQKNIISLEDVKDCFVVCETFEDEKKIIAFLKLNKNDLNIDENKIKTQMRQKLLQKIPEYMIPSDFVIKTELPLNLNGKVDKLKLLSEYKAAIAANKEYVNENIILQILSQSFNKKITDEDSLFEIGFNSISAIHILSALRKQGLNISMKTILSAKTVGELKELVDKCA